MAEMTLGDLLAWEPRLRLIGAAGSDPDEGAAAERELTWAVAARATAPMLPPLRGGELILLPHRILRESGVGIGPLLRELAAHAAAGVVLEAEAVPPGLRAVGAPLPLLVVPVGPMTPELEGDLNRLLTQKRGELYRAGTDLGRLLAGLTTAGADLGQILAATADALDVAVDVVDAKGLVVAASAGQGSRSVGGERRDLGPVIRLAGGESLRFDAVKPERTALVRLAGERVAMAAEAALARAAQARPRGPARSAALSAFLRLSPSVAATELGARAAALGLSADVTYRVAFAPAAAGFSALQRIIAPHGGIHEAGTIDGAIAAVVEVRAPESVRLTTARTLLRDAGKPVTGETRIGPAVSAWVALSGPAVGATALPAATRQGRFAAALLTKGMLRGPVVRFDVVSEMGPFRLLYAFWGSAELSDFATDALGDLPLRDRRGQLRRTLLAYLETGGSHVDAAARLGIHRNTLAYRLKQIASLTDHDPADPANRLMLHLALVSATLPPVPE